MKPFIIADIGSNHRGSFEIAKSQIESAKAAGCDAAKFQLFSGLELFGFEDRLVDQFSIKRDWVPELKKHCDDVGIEFMCTAFSPEGVRFIDPFVKRHKVASSDFTHHEIIEEIKKTNKPWIVSTGGAGWSEVESFIKYHAPTALLECVARYPSPVDNYDLACLTAWRNKADYDLLVGVSDHTTSNVVALASVGFGATIFEKHFDGIFGENTPDTPVSYKPLEMEKYCFQINEAFSAIGDGIKQPRHQSEMTLKWRRRLIVTNDLPVGAKLESHVNYGIYRSLVPDTRGAHPSLIEEFNGKTLMVDKKKGDSLCFSDIG